MKPAPISGLVLAGGHSVRMGADKATLLIHEQPQLEWTAALLAPRCQRVFASVRGDQVAELQARGVALIPDLGEIAGPLAGIQAALQQQPASAWLVVACDMPWLSPETLDELLANRNPSSPVTAFAGRMGPEPLCAIWEPQALDLMQRALDRGERSPRRIIEQMPCTRIKPSDPDALISINTPEMLDRARRELR